MGCFAKKIDLNAVYAIVIVGGKING